MTAAGLLVLATPWQVPPGSGLELALRRHLSRGGDILFAYRGAAFEPGEDEVARALGLGWASARGPALSSATS